MTESDLWNVWVELDCLMDGFDGVHLQCTQTSLGRDVN